MKTPLFLALCLCAAPALAQPQPAPSQPQPRSAIRATSPEAIETSVRNLARAINQGAFDSAQAYVANARIGYFGAQRWLHDLTDSRAFAIEVRNVDVVQLAEASARVTLTYHLYPADGTAETLHRETLEMRGTSSQTSNPKTRVLSQIWQIVPPATKPVEPQKENEAAANWFAYLSWKLAQQPLAPADYAPVESIANLKMLSLAALQRSQDYDSIAAAPEYLEEALRPYLKSDRPFFVPNSDERYAFNANLSDRYIGADMLPQPPNAVQNQKNAVLFYEGRDEKLNFRYDGRAAVSFADGHAALVTPDEAKALIWRP